MLATVACAIGRADIAIYGPDFPTPAGPDGGEGSGDPGIGAGWTYSYDGIDTSQVSELWFGLDPDGLPNLELGQTEADMEFSSAADNQMEWTGEATFDYNTVNDGTYKTAVVDTRFTMTLGGGVGDFFDAGELAAIDPLFDTSIEAMSRITGDYTATFLFEATDPENPGVWMPANELFNFYVTPAGATTQMNVGGALYRTLVPGPSTLIIWSLLGGLGVAVGWWRRRKPA